MLIWISMLMACTNSGLGKTSTGDTGVEPCPWEGEWEMTSVRCGTIPDEYEKWTNAYADSVMVITTGADGICEVEFTWSAAKCAEKEEWTLDPDYPEQSTVQWNGDTLWVNQGVTECSPPSCTFDTSGMSDVAHEPCAEGNRENAQTFTVKVDSSIDGQLEIEDLFSDTERSDCPLGLQTTWVKQ